jgi:hypothetical protein
VIRTPATLTDLRVLRGQFRQVKGVPSSPDRSDPEVVTDDIKIERIMSLVTTFVNREDDRIVAEPRMVSLGFGKFARSDHIYALEPLLGDERGDGHRTKVWVEGIKDPIIAARTEVTILRDMGQEAAATEAPLIDEALDLASRLAAAAEAGRVDLNDLGRRARHFLASTTTQDRLL